MSRISAQPSGNPRRPVDVTQAPTVHTGRAPRVPAKLGRAGAEVWREVWAAGDGAYSPVSDRLVIERYCELHDRREALLSVLDRDGLAVEGSQGQPVAHWALRYVESTERELRAIETVLGLNLEARLRLGLTANAAARPSLSDFLDTGD